MNLNAVAMALAGYNEQTNHLWRQTCGAQRRQLSSPYLRAIFAFLASDSEYYEDVLVSVCRCIFGLLEREYCEDALVCLAVSFAGDSGRYRDILVSVCYCM